MKTSMKNNMKMKMNYKFSIFSADSRWERGKKTTNTRVNINAGHKLHGSWKNWVSTPQFFIVFPCRCCCVHFRIGYIYKSHYFVVINCGHIHIHCILFVNCWDLCFYSVFFTCFSFFFNVL